MAHPGIRAERQWVCGPFMLQPGEVPPGRTVRGWHLYARGIAGDRVLASSWLTRDDVAALAALCEAFLLNEPA